MAPKSGLSGFVIFSEETVYGTYVPGTFAVPLVSETLTNKKERLESNAVISGQRVIKSQQWNGGNIVVSGQLVFEVVDRGLGLLLKHMFGSYSTTGTNPYTHVASPGDIDGKSLSIQIGRPGVGGTVVPFSYTGCKIQKWDLSVKAGEIALLTLDVVAQQESTAQTLAAPAYTSGLRPVKFNHGALTIAAASVPVKTMQFTGVNNLDDTRRFIGSQLLQEPLEKDLRDYTANLEPEFTDLTLYNLYTGGTEAALSAVFTIGANTLTLAGNTRYDGDTPNIAGKAILMQKIPAKFIASSTDASAITVTAVDTVATP
jgi:hypothetical protein